MSFWKAGAGRGGNFSNLNFIIKNSFIHLFIKSYRAYCHFLHIIPFHLKHKNKFMLKGTADPSQSGVKSFNRIVLHKSKFSLILANNGTVVDNMSFVLRGGSIGGPISFNRKFECEMPFDAGGIHWEAKVQG